MENNEIISVTEANSMQPAIWRCESLETFNKRKDSKSWQVNDEYKMIIREIRVEKVRIDGDPFETVIARNWYGEQIHQWQIRSVNLTFKPQ